MKYTPDELRGIANSDSPSEWGDKRAALLWAADVIESGNKLIDEQAKELSNLKEIKVVRETKIRL